MKFLPGHTVKPLMEADETYPALEKAIASARESVHMAYWTIDPTLPVVSDTTDGAWSDLIAKTVNRGVTVRLVIADFDPILGRRFHRTAWVSYRHFVSLRDRIDRRFRDRLQVMCSRHEARVGTAVRILGQPVIQAHLSEAVNELNKLAEENGTSAAMNRLAELPGLWPHVDVKEDRIAIAHPTLPTAYPAAHHEKLCVIDDSRVFLGGLDINERRYDNAQHDDELAWHDIACELAGPGAQFFARHFRERWNNELSDFQEFVSQAEPPEGVAPLPSEPTVRPIDTDIGSTTVSDGNGLVAPLRTISAQVKSTLSRSPESLVTEVRDAYVEIIGTAERLIYIETQFLRSKTIVDALLSRAREVDGLEIIVILPVVPEMALIPGEPDVATKQGQHLQKTLLARLTDELSNRFAVFTMVRDGPPEPDPVCMPQKTEADIVYVHAKVMVVDDATAIIGSANLNDRSMLTDTETAIAWREPGAVKRFRDALWDHALGVDASDWEDNVVDRWQAHALHNASLPAAERHGFVVPMTQDLAAAHAAPSLIVPSELI